MAPDPFISVAEDIEELRSWGEPGQWSPEPSDADLRRGSAILRRFLSDQLLQRAWRAHGLHESVASEPRVRANEIDLDAEPRLHSFHAIYADSGFEIATEPLILSGQKVQMRSHEREFGLNEYRDSIAIQIAHGGITRGDLVKYFANTLGGVHLDTPAGKPKRQHADARKKEEVLAQQIRRVENQIQIMGRESIRHELREIGRRLGASDDLQLLETRIRTADQ
jgi:hypothetical protein